MATNRDLAFTDFCRGRVAYGLGCGEVCLMLVRLGLVEALGPSACLFDYVLDPVGSCGKCAKADPALL
jgi:hypothetical protein